MPGRGPTVPASKPKFSLLSEPPRPLPDIDAPAAAVAVPEPPPPPARRSVAQADPATAPGSPAALTVRLHRSAAEPLNEAWLNERRLTDPKLSYPEFASRIVQLGLTAWERKQRGKSA
jgi:hypothetical protein